MNDFDLDGNLDVAGADDYGSRVSVLLGVGDGSLGPPTGYGTGNVPVSLAAADLNRDGKPGLVVAGTYPTSILTLLNIASPHNANPECAGARASIPTLWPPDRRMVPVGILGVTDPDGDPIRIVVTGVTQDEPISRIGRGAACRDASIAGGQARLRAERAGGGNGRVYRISVRAEDGRGGACEGSVAVCVPANMGHGRSCSDDGQRYNSLGSCPVAGSEDFEAGPDSITGPSLRAIPAGDRMILEYALPMDADVTLAVYDLAGRRVAVVRNARESSGVHRANWNPGGLGGGLYFYRLTAGVSVSTTRGFLIK
jgi:hypothetical protein